jgi:hypothetical protein
MTVPDSPIPGADGPSSAVNPSPGSREAKVTAGTAPYVTRPTGWTRFTRTFVPWQLWRFARINMKMIRIIRSSRT